MSWVFYALLSALAVSATTLLEKRDLKTQHSFEYALFLSAVNLLLALLLLPWVKVSFDWLLWGVIYLASLLGTLALWFSTKALRHMSVSQVAPLSSLSVLFTVLLAILFLGERLSLFQALGIFLFLYALWFLSQVDFIEEVLLHPLRALGKAKPPPNFYPLLMVIATAFMGITAILDKWVISRVGVINFIFLIHSGLFLNHLLLYLLVNRQLAYLKAGLSQLKGSILLVSFLNLFSRLSYAYALFLAPVSLVAPVKRLSVFFSTLLGGVFFKEAGVLLRVLLAVLMLLGTYLIVQ